MERTDPVTPKVMTEIREGLDVFLSEFDDCFLSKPSRRHLRTYVNGQTSHLSRKSVEPMALEAGVPPRSLQEFLGLHHWDHARMRQRLQQRICARPADGPVIGIVDESGMPKKGDKTACVQRQYCGATGKIDNCVVSVNLGYAIDSFATLIDGDLYLPESWASDRERCRRAHIPDTVLYRPKWQIALELIDRATAHGVRFDFITADEFYGEAGDFRKGLQDRRLHYVVEVPCAMRGWSTRPQLAQDRKGGLRPSKGQPAARRAEHLWLRGGPSWAAFHVKDTEKGPVVWKVRATRFFPAAKGSLGSELWLLVARNVVDNEVKYFVSNCSSDTPVENMLKVAFSRSHIEHLFEEAKGDIGWDHFEVRSHLALQRHLLVSMLSFLFLAEQEQRLKKKKPVVEPRPSARGRRSAA